MSSDDQPRDDGGQYTSAEALTGLPGVEAEAGYTQMPAPETPNDDMDEVPTFAEFEAIMAQDESAVVTPIVYFDGDGERAMKRKPSRSNVLVRISPLTRATFTITRYLPWMPLMSRNWMRNGPRL
jgi:hypothetical protein